MRKSSFFLIFCLLFCCCGCAGKTDTVTMYAVQVNENGAVLSDCKITLNITEESGAGLSYTPFKGGTSFSDTDDAPFLANELACSWYSDPPACHYVFSGLGYVAADNRYTGILLYLDPEWKTCLIQLVEQDGIYVASTDPNFDPKILLESYSEHLS